MSIATQISRLTTLRDNIRTKLIALGIISSSSADLEDCYNGINGVTARTSSDLTASGATVSVAKGYYNAAASKAIASGSATTPATTITSAPSISISSAGVITASNSKTQSVTPTVSAGYVSAGTAGTITINGSNTEQMTVKAATTWTPTTSNQTIASGTYLTGTQTIKGDANLVAANIADGVTIFGITGTFEGGTDTSDATATAADIRSGKTAYIADGSKATGTYVPYLEFTNKSVAASAFSANATYSNYPYRAAIACSGATADMFPYVEFSADDKISGYFCPEAQSYAGGVYIYALEAKAVTVSKITFYKRS